MLNIRFAKKRNQNYYKPLNKSNAKTQEIKICRKKGLSLKNKKISTEAKLSASDIAR